MRNVRKLGRFLIAGAVMVAVVVLAGDSAFARPKYASVASKQYPDLAEKHGKNGKLSCAMCHPVMDKKKRNNYGAAFGGGLTKKNESDEDKIKEALTKAEGEKSATEGKTFGDLIKAGEMPGTSEPVN
jgi:hypothetical protein